MTTGPKEVMGELIWDHEGGYAYIQMTPAFKRADPILCLDALSDWSTGITHEYNEQYDRSIRDFERKRQVQKMDVETNRQLNKRKTKKQ